MTDLQRRELAPEVHVDPRDRRRNESALLLAATALPLIGGFILIALARLFIR